MRREPCCLCQIQSGSKLTLFNSILGTALAWRFRKDSKGEFLSGNRTRTGQEHDLPSSESGVERDDSCRAQDLVASMPDLRP